MATIKTAISLYDGVTAPLQHMNRALNIMLNSFESVQSASGKAIDVSSIHAARSELAQASVSFDKIEDSARRAAEQQENFKRKTVETGNAASGLESKFASIATRIGAVLGIRKMFELSDSMTNTTARLDLMNDGLQTTETLQNRIMESANRSRASYQTTADAITKLGINAKEAFSSNAEVIAFTEQINKQFVLAGTSAQGIDAAMMQLTQAMGSGVLRGEELNSIFEQSPTIIQTIADYLGVSIGKIRELAKDGKITASVVKNAMFWAADETNEKFNKMPMTFAQVWNKVQNVLLKAFTPIIQAIGKGAQWISDNWSALEPIFWGVGAAVLAYAAGLGAMKVAAIVARIAQEGLNAAMLASPIAWISLAIGVLVGAITWLSNKVGGLGNLWDIVWNAMASGVSWAAYGVLWAIDQIVFAIEEVQLFSIRAFNWISNALDNFAAGFMGVIQTVVNAVVDAINWLMDVMGTRKWLAKSLGIESDSELLKIQHVSFGDDTRKWADDRMAGRATGYENIAGFYDRVRDDRTSKIDSVKQAAIDSWGKSVEAQNRMNNGDVISNADEMNAGIYNNTGATAENTAKTAGAVSMATEELKMLRDIAERKAINKFTTAEVRLDMSGMQNHINSEMDIDGFIDIVTVKLEDALVNSAEGVHI